MSSVCIANPGKASGGIGEPSSANADCKVDQVCTQVFVAPRVDHPRQCLGRLAITDGAFGEVSRPLHGQPPDRGRQRRSDHIVFINNAYVSETETHGEGRSIVDGFRLPCGQEIADRQSCEWVSLRIMQLHPIIRDADDDDEVICADWAVLARLVPKPAHLYRTDPDWTVDELRSESLECISGILGTHDGRRPAHGIESGIEASLRRPAEGIEEGQRPADELHPERATCGELDACGGWSVFAKHHREGVRVAIWTGAYIRKMLHELASQIWFRGNARGAFSSKLSTTSFFEQVAELNS
ncbi:hypothetical protein I7G01_05390 [Sinorhizobium meliloti]|nr:hypothetical protein [Sinorhizobium meliloti]MDE3778776.1 hypothetical protein [Sinorhizobium meliloti]MDE3802957.1 hypothetical protein [Sinorhizobium meliloti]